MTTKHNTEEILGIRFFTGEADAILAHLENGGLLTAPAAPALIELGKDLEYTASLLESDIVIPDSGLMALLWFIRTGKPLPKLSGLKLLRLLLNQKELKTKGTSFWIKPTYDAQTKSFNYLKNKGFSLTEEDFYIAPMYNRGSIKDPLLIEILNNRRPSYIFINIGGGKQEVLGLYLKENLSYKPAILCTGAAIAFLTGEQANIPEWADKLGIGWLLRCVKNPKKFALRYIKALKLIPILLRNRERLPANETR